MNETAVTLIAHGTKGWIALALFVVTLALTHYVAYRQGRAEERFKNACRRADELLDEQKQAIENLRDLLDREKS